ncbi:MAG: hypothetical protein R6X02_02985 [Enhygromyxa sp.]
MDLDELVAAAQAGDKRALQALLRRLPVALRPCFGADFDRADIDDLIQTTSLVILQKLHKFEPLPGKPFIRWARGIARLEVHKERGTRRRCQRLKEQASRLPPPPTTSLNSRMDRAANVKLVHAAIGKLNSPLRRVVENDLEEGDVDEFVEREGIKRDSVRVRRSRAYGKMRRFVRRRRIHVEKTPTPRSE